MHTLSVKCLMDNLYVCMYVLGCAMSSIKCLMYHVYVCICVSCCDRLLALFCIMYMYIHMRNVCVMVSPLNDNVVY